MFVVFESYLDLASLYTTIKTTLLATFMHDYFLRPHISMQVASLVDATERFAESLCAMAQFLFSQLSAHVISELAKNIPMVVERSD